MNVNWSNGMAAPPVLSRVRSTWNADKLLFTGPLTDEKINRYQARGFYSEEFRQDRRERMAKKAAERWGALTRLRQGFGAARRDGNFILKADGSLVFSPV